MTTETKHPEPMPVDDTVRDDAYGSLLAPTPDEPAPAVPVAASRASRLSIIVAPSWLIYAGAAATVIGFALLAYTWDRVSTLTIVAAQIPWLVSSGLTGLGLIVVGAAMVIVWSRRSDDTERKRQTEELISALREIRAGLEAGRDR